MFFKKNHLVQQIATNYIKTIWWRLKGRAQHEFYYREPYAALNICDDFLFYHR